MFKKILVAIDGSKNAKVATKYAFNLAAKFNSKVILMHVISETTVQNYLQFNKDSKNIIVYKLNKKAKVYFEDALKGIKEKDVKKVTSRGIPAIEITDLAKKENIDLIVIGTHGLTGSTRILLGSVAEEVIRLSPCPALTVKA